MGTSKNVSSPDTTPWKPALAVLGRNNVPPARQLQEVWRSAPFDRGPRLFDDFAAPTLAIACGLAQRRSSVGTLLNEYENLLQHDKKIGLAAEIGRRALAGLCHPARVVRVLPTSFLDMTHARGLLRRSRPRSRVTAAR